MPSIMSNVPLNGPQTFGNGRAFWLAIRRPAGGRARLSGARRSLRRRQRRLFRLIFMLMALGLSLIWGYGGMFSFGQTAFFGVAGYSYGVISINLGASGL